jgi:hypothetical protein
MVLNPDPLEGEDIIIENDKGNVVGVIIQPRVYDFLLKKIEEKENENDSQDYDKYNKDAPSLDDLIGE